MKNFFRKVSSTDNFTMATCPASAMIISKATNNIKTIIIFVFPRYKSVTEITNEGEMFEVAMPPTYQYPEVNRRITAVLKHTLQKKGQPAI